MEKTEMLSLLNSTQHQLNALQISLDMMSRQLQREITTEIIEEDNQFRCPQCKVVLDPDRCDITCMGDKQNQYACTDCDYRGPIT